MNAKILGILGLLVALCAFTAVANPESFLLPFNIENLLRRTALFGIIGIGVAFVIITGGIDLSIGSVFALIGVVMAILLNVSYAPLEGGEVMRVHADDSIIVVRGEAPFKPGDQVRYYGGRRARTAIMTVTDVKYTKSDSATVLHVNPPPSADDSAGHVARVATVVAVTRADAAAGKPATATLTGEFKQLDPRDQVMFVQGESGVNQLPVREVEVREGQTVISLDGELASVTEQWQAVLIERRQRMPVIAAVGALFGMAVLLGLTHGLLITKVPLQPFVVTLCGLLIYRGLARWIVDDQTVRYSEYSDTLGQFATGKLALWQRVDETGAVVQSFGIPYPLIIFAVVAIIAAVFLNKTIWGRYMLALGRNEEAARYSGINTHAMTILAYVICTALACLGAILFALDSNSVAPSSHGNFYELYAIAAAVLGGCSLRGGEGSILGVLIGTAVIVVLYNMVLLLKISTTLEFAIIGAVILLGVIADEMVKRYAARRRAAKAAAATDAASGGGAGQPPVEPAAS